MDSTKFLCELECQLINDNTKRAIELTRTWANDFPDKAGVYVLFEDKEIVYVGETRSIKERMMDYLDTRHHTVRRKIGLYNYSKIKGFKKANSKNKFPIHIEKMVCDWLKDRVKICFLPIDLGRKELEEYIIEKYRPKYNSNGRRGSKSSNN